MDIEWIDQQVRLPSVRKLFLRPYLWQKKPDAPATKANLKETR